MSSILASTSSTFSSNPLWYLTRSTAIVGFLLLTLGTVLGVAATQRSLASRAWPRFATQALHRNVNVLGLAFIIIHILTTLLDSYVHVGWLATLVPFTSSYRTLSVAAGTLALDVFLLVAATGFLRLRMKERGWRRVHVTAYLAWPLALLHFIGTGTDGAYARWGFWIALGSAAAVGAAAWLRLVTPRGPRGPVRSVAGAR